MRATIIGMSVYRARGHKPGIEVIVSIQGVESRFFLPDDLDDKDPVQILNEWVNYCSGKRDEAPGWYMEID